METGLAQYVYSQFSQGKGAELSMDLTGLPVAEPGVARVFVVPSVAWGVESGEVLITCDRGGMIVMDGSRPITKYLLISAGFNEPVAIMMLTVLDQFAALAATKKNTSPVVTLTETSAS